MRQDRSDARLDADRATAEARPGKRRTSNGQIVEIPDDDLLPVMERLRPVGSAVAADWWRGGAPLDGQIVEDRLDGSLVYPEPPRRIRNARPVRRLVDRVSTPMWLFVLLALAQASTAVADVWSSGDWSASAVMGLVLRAGYAVGLALIPAGILMWRPDAWRTARLALLGAIVWTTLPALAGLVWWAVSRSPDLMDRYGYAWAAVVATVAVAACAGPALVAFGLERGQGFRTGWLAYLAPRAAVVTALATLWNVARWLPASPRPFQPVVPSLGGGFDRLHLAGSISGMALPVELLCLLILAGVCIWAVMEGELQSRLWQCAAAGATLLAFAAFYELLTGHMADGVATGNLAAPGLATRGLAGAAATALSLGGIGLILCAFTSPIWSAARDADVPGLGAPDEVFSWGAAAAAHGSEPLPMTTIVAAAAGPDHALALDANGRVGAWGDDSVGQTDVPDGLCGVVAIAAGDGFSLALRGDGTVVAWGLNDSGQSTVPRGLDGVISIAAGSGFALALRADGTVRAWGEGVAAQVPAGLAGVTAISAGESHVLALRANGTVVAWGDDGCGQSDVPTRLAQVKSISAGGDFSLALLADGTVSAWGDNNYGQLDVPAGLENVTAIAAGAFHALALCSGGDVICWGGGGQRQGEATHPWRLVDFKAVAAGDGYSLAIRAA
jgi:hypothetical protein